MRFSQDYCSKILRESRSVGDGRWNCPAYGLAVKTKGRVAAAFVQLWSLTVSLKKLGWEYDLQARRDGKPVLYLCWHGSQIIPLASFRNRGIVIMTSLSKDGDIQTQSMLSLGYRVIRGSSSRGGARALLGMTKLMKNGFSASITVDGPRGPFHKAKPGAVILAQKTGATVVPIGVGYSKAHRLKNWDRFEIPVPFSRACLALGRPFQISSDCTLEEGILLIEQSISECDRLAQLGVMQ